MQFMRVRLASNGRRISKESLLLKKEWYRRVLRTLWVRRCTNEDIGKEMNVISDWLLQYVRRKKRFFPSCNQAICISWKGRIGRPTIKWKQTVKEGVFWLYGEGNNDGSKQTSASSCCVRSHGPKREYVLLRRRTTYTFLLALNPP